MDRQNSIIDSVNAFAWGSPMLGSLGVTGLLLTLGLAFMPWRKVGHGFRLLFDKSGAVGGGEVKPFTAVMTALTEPGGGEGRRVLEKDGKPEWHFVPDTGRRSLCRRLVLVVTVLCTVGMSAAGVAATPLVLAYFLPASGMGPEGFARIINHSDAPGTVEIVGIDDAGVEYGPIELSLEARESVHFNSGDLERGNPEKGLSALGDGEGAWLLSLTSELDVELLSYVRTEDGFVTAMHQGVPAMGMRHHVRFFNPGSNDSQVSRLRLVNPTGDEVEVTIEGRDDAGEPAPGGEVRLTLAPGEARTLSARVLESGGEGLDGALGDGAGKWQLFVSADSAMHVMSLLASPTGHLSNLSAPGVRADVCGVVDIPDAGLRAAVEGALGKAAGTPITGAEMATLKILSASNRGIQRLTRLECATGLTRLSIAFNQISDVTPLSGLMALAYLNLTNNQSPDVTPLSGLTALTRLNLGNNQISDVTPLSGLTALTLLGLWQNRISDVTPLSGLTALTTLSLWQNQISDVTPLSGLTGLTTLNLSSNQISDISPLVSNAGLDDGDELDLRSNSLSAESLNTHVPALRARGVIVEVSPQETARIYSACPKDPPSAPLPPPQPASCGCLSLDNGYGLINPTIPNLSIGIGGQVVAHEPVSSVRVIGYYGGVRVGDEFLGDMAAFELKYFSISGFIYSTDISGQIVRHR